MGINPLRIKPTKTTFKGVIPGVEAHCTGSITLEVVFGSLDNFRSKELIFDIVPFRSGYHALLGRTAFARFNAVPHYAYLKLKMPGPRGVIIVNGKMDRSLLQKSILQPSRQKYNAASSGKPPIRRRQPQAPSSEFGAPRNRITRHAKSATSSPASAQAPSKQHSCHAYTITHSRYHGHRRRRINDSDDNTGNCQIPSYPFPLPFQDTTLV